MTEPLMNLIAALLVAMLGACFLHEQFGFHFWPAVAGCAYLLILSNALHHD